MWQEIALFTLLLLLAALVYFIPRLLRRGNAQSNHERNTLIHEKNTEIAELKSQIADVSAVNTVIDEHSNAVIIRKDKQIAELQERINFLEQMLSLPEKNITNLRLS